MPASARSRSRACPPQQRWGKSLQRAGSSTTGSRGLGFGRSCASGGFMNPPSSKPRRECGRDGRRSTSPPRDCSKATSTASPTPGSPSIPLTDFSGWATGSAPSDGCRGNRPDEVPSKTDDPVGSVPVEDFLVLQNRVGSGVVTLRLEGSDAMSRGDSDAPARPGHWARSSGPNGSPASLSPFTHIKLAATVTLPPPRADDPPVSHLGDGTSHYVSTTRTQTCGTVTVTTRFLSYSYSVL